MSADPADLYPLTFRLVDPTLDEPVFYLGDRAQTFTLALINRGDAAITLAADGHLDLRFRPGLLAGPDGIALADGADGWTLTASQVGASAPDEGTIVVRLQRSGPDLTLPAGAQLELGLTGLRADSSRGARESTVRLEYSVRFPDLAPVVGTRSHRVAVLHATPSALQADLADLAAKIDSLAASPDYDDSDLQRQLAALEQRPNADVEALARSVDDLLRQVEALQTRVKTLEQLLSDAVADEQQLRALVPPRLDIDIVGPASVGADGVTHDQISLRIRNAAGAAIQVTQARTRLSIRIDEWSIDQPWGLVQADQLGSISPSISSGWSYTRRDIPGTSFFDLRPTADRTLAADASITLALTGIVGHQRPGVAHITVDYAGIDPADQHGSTTVAIRRTYIVETVPLETDTVTTPTVEIRSAQLHVNLGATIEGALLAQSGATVSGATLLAQSGATVSGAPLLAQSGATVSGAPLLAQKGATVSGAPLLAQNGATIDGAALLAKFGATVSGGQLGATAGATISGSPLFATSGAIVDGGRLVAKAGADVAGPLTAGSLAIGCFVLEPAPWVGLNFRCTYNADIDLRTTYALRANYSHVGQTRELASAIQAPAPNLPLFMTRQYKVSNFSNTATGLNTADWHACVIGFHAGTGDLNEDGAGSDLLQCHVTTDTRGQWYVYASLRTHFTVNEWTVNVLFLARGLIG